MKPVPLIAALLTITGAVPVEVRITVFVAEAFTATLPNVRLVVLTLSVGTDAPSCRAKVCVVPPALAVSVTAAPELTDETVAVKFALAAPDATFTDAGTVTALLLLPRLTANPPLAAAAFSATVQLSVPVPVIEPFVQLSPLNTGEPVPLRLIVDEVPVDESLVRVRAPVAAPATVGSNCTATVAVPFGAIVKGKFPFGIENPAPVTVAALTVTAAVPIDDKVMF